MCTNSITCNENEINMWNGLCKYEVDWIHVHVCVAPPIVVGAWSMAGMLYMAAF